MMNLDPGQLDALAAAVSEGTFDAAARHLHVTPSAISQRVKALETAVGRVLLTRSKPVRPTPSGEAVLRLARQISTVTADVLREIGEPDTGAGPVTVSLAANADSLSTWLLPAFAAAGPDIVFDVRRDDQERTADLLRRGEVMAAVTASARPVPGCVVEPLGRMRYRPVATAAFAATWFPDGPTVSALSHAPVVDFDRDDRLQAGYLRRRARRELSPPRHFVPGSSAYAAAVRLGLGWGMLPDLQREPGDGLVELDPHGTTDVRLHWQQWRLRSTALDRAATAIRAAARGTLH
jgi:LysR family transcriptional regulator, chromosome initiation inhibitor